MSTEEVSIVCDDDKHQWEETYYGDKCRKCGMFCTNGNTPWATHCRHGIDIDDWCTQCVLGI